MENLMIKFLTFSYERNPKLNFNYYYFIYEKI